MKRTLFAALLALLCSCLLSAQDKQFEWKTVLMDGSRTGCTCPNADNSRQAIGKVRGKRYKAPNGTRHKGIVAYAAKDILNAQTVMAPVKEVVGWSTREMSAAYPESELSNMFIDCIMASTEMQAGKHVSFGVGNFGGIRSGLPQGAILYDDLLSMFPFKNQIVYLELKGSRIRELLESMAETRFQVLGGVKVKVKDHKLVSVEIDGEPLDDNKTYGVATISFLLNGGDGLYMGKDAMNLKVYSDLDIIDIMLAYVRTEAAAGRNIEYHKDGRVTILKGEE